MGPRQLLTELLDQPDIGHSEMRVPGEPGQGQGAVAALTVPTAARRDDGRKQAR
jgi:hypothetical protein